MKQESAWVLFALGSAVFGGLTAILGKIGVEGVNSNFATLYRTFVVLVLCGLIVSARGEWKGAEEASLRTWTFLTLSGLATAASWLCYYRALQLAPASRVAPIDKMSVVVAIALGIIVLGEPLSLKLALGAILIVAGVFIVAIA